LRPEVDHQEIGLLFGQRTAIQQMIAWQIAAAQLLPAALGAEKLDIRGELLEIPKWAELNHFQLAMGHIARMAHDDDIEILTVRFPRRFHSVEWTPKKQVTLL
jgi:hypothetical protein